MGYSREEDIKGPALTEPPWGRDGHSEQIRKTVCQVVRNSREEKPILEEDGGAGVGGVCRVNGVVTERIAEGDVGGDPKQVRERGQQPSWEGTGWTEERKRNSRSGGQGGRLIHHPARAFESKSGTFHNGAGPIGIGRDTGNFSMAGCPSSEDRWPDVTEGE